MSHPAMFLPVGDHEEAEQEQENMKGNVGATRSKHLRAVDSESSTDTS